MRPRKGAGFHGRSACREASGALFRGGARPVRLRGPTFPRFPWFFVPSAQAPPSAAEEGRTRGSLARFRAWRRIWACGFRRRAAPAPARRFGPGSGSSDRGAARRSRGGPARACVRRGGRPGLAVDDGAPASAGVALVSGRAASLLDRLGAARPSGRGRLQGRRLAFEGARRVHRLEPPGAGGESRAACGERPLPDPSGRPGSESGLAGSGLGG